jgi:polyisoprenoid-binding protein YceI
VEESDSKDQCRRKPKNEVHRLKDMTKLILIPVLVFSSLFAGLAGNWNIDEDYAIKFSTAKAEGTLTGLTGTIVFDEEDLSTASFNVSVDATSIKTGSKMKDKHARGKSWLYTTVYSEITFESTAFKATDSGYTVTGDLSIRGVTKSVDIPFTFRENIGVGLFEGTTTILREDYGIDGPFLFSKLVGDEIEVSLRVPVK